jgi:predicted amidohydrolase YtcJ
MLIRGERITSTGSRSEMARRAAPGYTELDVRGRVVIPGLIDTHTRALDRALSVIRNEIDSTYLKADSIEAVLSLQGNCR